jgi:hypothetical protein
MCTISTAIGTPVGVDRPRNDSACHTRPDGPNDDVLVIRDDHALRPLLVGQGRAREPDDPLHAFDAVLVAGGRCMVHEIRMAQLVEHFEPPIEDHLVDEPLDDPPVPVCQLAHAPHSTDDRPTTTPKSSLRGSAKTPGSGAGPTARSCRG